MSHEPSARARVLLVDDDDLLLRFLAKALAADVDVECASSIDEALAKLDARIFDAVLSDYELRPGLGTALLALVRVRTPSTRRFLMSANGALARKILESGDPACEVFFQKPFDVQALLDAVRRPPPR